MPSILLGMDDVTADIFKQKLLDYSSSITFIDQNVGIFHNTKRAIKSLKPDIFLVSMNHIRFDGEDCKKELLKGLTEIRFEPSIQNVRIAVQADMAPTDEFLRKLALIKVDDIFSGTEQNPSEFNMTVVAKQLLSEPNLKYIYKYLNLDKPLDNDGAIFEPLLSNTSVIIDDSGRIKQLEKLIKILQSQKNELEKQADIQSIPREDYDDLLSKYQNIMQSGLTSDSFKKLFKKIVDISQKQKTAITHLKGINHQLNNSVIDLNSQIELLENQSTQKLATEMKQIKVENNRLKSLIADQHYSYVDGNRTNTNIVTKKGKQSTTHKNKLARLAVILLSLLVILGIGLGGFYVFQQKLANQANQVQQQKTSFSSLIKARNYEKAAKYYPSKAVSVENIMLTDKKLASKKTMAEKIGKYSSSNVIRFDIAYFEQDYATVVDIYKNSSSLDLTKPSDERRVMAAYSLMKIGNTKDAKMIAKPLNNANLNRIIEIYFKFDNANKILNNKIQNEHLSKKEKNKARKQIRENQQAMDKL